jgi:pimeloyl-ACP methyl ester carboxylesterase
MKPTLIILTVLAALAFAGPASAAPKLDWKPCDDGFECATAKVPLDYDHPSGRKLELALTRARAADPKTRLGSVFFHPGGPGGSGVDSIHNAPPQAIAAVTRRYDIIGFDARGAGHSHPVADCKVDSERDGARSQPFIRPETLDVGTFVDHTMSYLRRCMKVNGDVMAHMSSAEVARDLDELRAAVGDKRLNYIGHSQGTLVGADYASLFPGRVGRMILDSPVDAETWTHEPFEAIREQTASLEDELDRFFAATGFSEDDFDDLMEQLDRKPLGSLDGNDLRAAAMAISSPREWPAFKDALVAAQHGDGGALRAMTDEYYGGALFGFDLEVATNAADQLYPRRVKPFLRAGRHSAALFPHFFNNSGYEEMAYGLLPISREGAYHGPFRNSYKSAPALVIGTTHDPYTPYVWAKHLTHDLGNARLLTYRGDGHGAVTDLNPCILGHMLPYLEEGVLPPTGASCKQDL